MKRYIIFYFIVFCILILFFLSDEKNYTYLIHEEATPIRDLDEIKGMLYRIDIDNSINDKNIDISSKIISSINHYKDISNINSFYVDLEVDNDYIVDGISIVNNDNYIIRDILFDKGSNDIKLNLEKDDFSNYKNDYDVRIKLKRNTRKI